MVKHTILDLIERELENELQYKSDSDNADIIKELIEAYQFINKKHFTSTEQLINTLTLNDLIKTYKEV